MQLKLFSGLFVGQALLTGTASAITIRNYVHDLSCMTSNYRSCNSVPPYTCCTSSSTYSASRFIGTPASFYVEVCEPYRGKSCGVVSNSRRGSNVCVPNKKKGNVYKLLRGSLWRPCRNCRKRDGAEAEASDLVGKDIGQEVKSVEPDTVYIDGHAFTLKGIDQPEEAIKFLDEQVDNRTASYADIVKSFKAWEIAIEED